MTTESKIYWSVGILSVFIIIGSFFLPNDARRPDDLPWHIEHPTPDSVRIFGLTLGESDTNMAQSRFKVDPEPRLFKSPDGKLVAEVFFGEVNLARLPSTIVLTISVPEEQLKGMYERGLRMSSTGSAKRITMTADDVAQLRTYPISSLTYLPSVHVDDGIFVKRFGQPAQRIREKKSGLVHWLYPQDGLDITVGNGQKPLLQYVPPKDFDKLSNPLLANGVVLK